MTRRAARFVLRSLLSMLAGFAASAGAQQPPASAPVETAERVVELPPMIVTETSKGGPQWYYANTTTGEYLSRCSVSLTREFISAQHRMRQLLHVLVPEKFFVTMDVPMITILERDQVRRGGADPVMQDILRLARAPERPAINRQPRAVALIGSQFALNLRLDDRDSIALFAYLNERTFDGARLVGSLEYVRLLLERRTPTLPAWLVEGVLAVYQQATFTRDPVSLSPAVWISRNESSWLARDPERPRTLLPMNELFAPDALDGDNGNEARARIWRGQAELFFRWALDPRNSPAREAFWKFTARAAEQPPTEEDFIACFGFGYAEMRDRLSDFLALAITEPVRINPGRLPSPPRVNVAPATPGQIARLRGEWERAEISYVKARHPSLAPRYIDHARRTLQRAYNDGERDPRLVASLALCEVDAGDAYAARAFLEEAADAGVARPRVYFELARLRFADLTRDQPPGQIFDATEIAPVVELLRAAVKQAPALPEIYQLYTEAWLRCNVAPPAEDQTALVRGAKLFPPRSAIAYHVALLLVKNGHKDEAAALLATSISSATAAPGRQRLLQLQAALAASPR